MQDPDVAETRDRAAVDVCRLPRDHGGTLAGGSALVMLSLHTLRCEMRGVPLVEGGMPHGHRFDNGR